MERTAENANDVFATVPASGRKVVKVYVHQQLTVGWETCDESGSFTTPNVAKTMMSPSGASAAGLASLRFEVYGTGETTITGDGSAGSAGTLVVRSTLAPEPVGVSSPSPYPVENKEYPQTEICKAGEVAGDDGYLTKTVTYGSFQHLMEPPGSVHSRWTKERILDKAANSPFSVPTGEIHAIFGLLTAGDYGGGIRLPRWLVYTCALPAGTIPRQGPGAYFGPTPAPETSPAAFGASYEYAYTLFDENLAQVYFGGSGYDDDAKLSQQFIEVPFERNHKDSDDGRQVGISYTTYDCATFSHLEGGDVTETSDVYLRVWLRLTSDGPCKESGHADAVMGLRWPIGDRKVIRGEIRG